MIDLSELAPGLALREDGIWYSQAIEAVSYPSDGNQTTFQLEDSSFWFAHRNACIAAAVGAFPPSDRGPIFDIGGGNGFVSVGLMRAGFEVALVEPGTAGVLNAKKRGVPTVICATIASAGFRPLSLGSVGLFDVVEHVAEDLSFLSSVRALVKPGGRLYVTVPAYTALWSHEDVVAGHFRRYTRGSICEVVARAGFTVDFATYIFRPLPLPIFILRSLPYRFGLGGNQGRSGGADDHHAGDGVAARALMWMLGGEVAKISAADAMAFGGSCLLAARAT